MNVRKSDDIIKQYCGDIDERIKSCRSKKVAELLKQRLCSELKRNCKSSIINRMLLDHADKTINKVFDQSGKNKYLETSNEKN